VRRRLISARICLPRWAVFTRVGMQNVGEANAATWAVVGLSTCLDWEIGGATAETWRSVKTVVFSDLLVLRDRLLCIFLRLPPTKICGMTLCKSLPNSGLRGLPHRNPLYYYSTQRHSSTQFGLLEFAHFLEDCFKPTNCCRPGPSWSFGVFPRRSCRPISKNHGKPVAMALQPS
jgi:hypothetical protein